MDKHKHSHPNWSLTGIHYILQVKKKKGKINDARLPQALKVPKWHAVQLSQK